MKDECIKINHLIPITYNTKSKQSDALACLKLEA